MIKMSTRNGSATKDKIRKIILEMDNEFCSYDVVKEYFKGMEKKDVKKSDWQRVYVMVGNVIKEMELTNKVKFNKWVESNAPIKKKMYMVMR